MNPIAVAARRREDRLTALTLLTAVAFGGLMFWLVPPVPPVPRMEPHVPTERPSNYVGTGVACTNAKPQAEAQPELRRPRRLGYQPSPRLGAAQRYLVHWVHQ